MKTFFIKLWYFIVFLLACIAYLWLGSYLIATVFAVTFSIWQFISLHLLGWLAVATYRFFFKH